MDFILNASFATKVQKVRAAEGCKVLTPCFRNGETEPRERPRPPLTQSELAVKPRCHLPLTSQEAADWEEKSKPQLRVKHPNCFGAPLPDPFPSPFPFFFLFPFRFPSPPLLFSSLGFFLSMQDGRPEGSTWSQNSPPSQERDLSTALWEEDGSQLECPGLPHLVKRPFPRRKCSCEAGEGDRGERLGASS